MAAPLEHAKSVSAHHNSRNGSSSNQGFLRGASSDNVPNVAKKKIRRSSSQFATPRTTRDSITKSEIKVSKNVHHYLFEGGGAMDDGLNGEPTPHHGKTHHDQVTAEVGGVC